MGNLGPRFKPAGWYFVTGMVVLFMAGCSRVSSSTLSQPPAHGTSFLLQYDMSILQADRNAAGNLKAVMEKRFSKMGMPMFWEPVSANQIRILTPITGEKDAEAARKYIARGGQVEFRLVHEKSDQIIANGETEPGYEVLKEKVTLADGSQSVTAHLVKIKPELSGQILQSAIMSHDELGRPRISMIFTGDAAKSFAQLTGDNIGKMLAIVLDGELQSAPMIREPITGGACVISGNFDEKETLGLANSLDCPLPFPITVAEVKTF